jgi:hypothetical protein
MTEPRTVTAVEGVTNEMPASTRPETEHRLDVWRVTLTEPY